MRLLATVEYDGTDFAGFQLQAHAGAPRSRTVQGVLEEAVAPLAGATGATTRIVGAGRTDAGVHAAGQVVHLDTDAPLAADVSRFLRAWNARLPFDVRVRDARPVPSHVHARSSALSRRYAYRIVNGAECSPLLRRYAHHVRPPLDLPAMRRAAAHLLGTHDFVAFAAGEGPGSTRRDVLRLEIGAGWVVTPGIWHTLRQWVAPPRAAPRAPPLGESSEAGRVEQRSLATAGVPPPDGVRVVTIEVEANAFLRHMVRRIAATLIDVGQGRLPPDEVGAILAAGDKGRAGQTAPARGLCLQHVRYSGDAPAPSGAGAQSVELDAVARRMGETGAEQDERREAEQA